MKTITITPNGSLRFVYDDAFASLLELGDATVRRASHVEPTDDGQWTADLAPVNGPVLGPFRLRRDALAAEVAWLNAHNLGVLAMAQ